MVSNNGHRQSLQQIVADLDATPASSTTAGVIEAGKYSGTTLYDPDGHALVEAGSQLLTPEQVRAAVLDGARLAWDECGCGAGCDAIEWPDRTALQDEAERGAPRYRKNTGARVTRLVGNGGEVVLATGGVHWGDLLH